MVKLNRKQAFLLVISSLIMLFLFTSCSKKTINTISNNTTNKEEILLLEEAHLNIEEYLVDLDNGIIGKHLAVDDRDILRSNLEEISVEYKNMITTKVFEIEKIKDINIRLNEMVLELPKDTKEQLFVKEMGEDAVLCYEKISGESWGSWDYSEAFVEDGYDDRGWSLVAEEGTFNWQYTSYGAKMSAYNSKEDSNIAWMISPKLAVGNSSIMNFESAQAYPAEGTQLKVLISENYTGKVAEASWIELSIPNLATPADGNWSYVASGEVSLSGYVGKEIYIAFKYIGSNILSTAFEIKNLEINNTSKVSSSIEKIEDPVFSPVAGMYSTTPQAITLLTETTGATIYYTTDGTNPTISSKKYVGGFDIIETKIIKAIAIKDGIESEVITSIYTLIEEGSETGYYASIGSQTGIDLKSALNDIIDNHTELSYGEAYDALIVTDRDPNNVNNVILLYTGKSSNGPIQYDGGSNDGWNREHVWAKSHGDFGTTEGAGTDIHHLRPADTTVNSARGNKEFDNGGTYHSEATECKTDTDSWEPRDEVKGDVARMMFYMAVRYEGEHGEIDLVLSNDINDDSAAPTHGKLSTLLEWNALDPVSTTETRRNDIIYSDYQHNRNPFIDHPEWVNAIWGN